MPVGLRSKITVRLAGLALSLGLLTLADGQQSAQAQEWPARPVKVLVPFAAGGNTDIIARLTAERLARAFPSGSFLVENQPGAGGLTVTAQVARSEPDGYTLMMASSPQLVIVPAMQKVPYDPLKDFTPIKLVTWNPFVLITNAAVPAKTVAEVIAFAKSKQPDFSYASGSLGSVSHLASALLFAKAGLSATPVHYRGGAPAMNDLIAGHLPVMFANLSEVLAQATNPSLRIIAVSSARRTPQLPAIPTVEEGGISGFDLGTWNGLVGPPGLPAEIVERIEKVLAEYVAEPETQKKMLELGLEAERGTAADFSRAIARDLPLWIDIVKQSGASAK